MQPSRRRGWCPGALRPMPTGDGLLARIRLRGGLLSPSLARALAESARRYGNGLVDLTARANLQIRGLSEASHADLLTYLADTGVLDEDPAAEAVRNILVSPLAGVDGFGALLDIASVAKALDQRLATDARLHGLPTKFSFLIDDGSWPSLAEAKADVRFEACRSDANDILFRVALDGTSKDALPLGFCRPPELESVAADIALGLLAEPEDAPLRERIRQGTRSVKANLDAPVGGAPVPRSEKAPHPPIGFFTGASGQAVLGLGLAFGRITAAALDLVADAAADLGCSALRATPWRALLMPLANPERRLHWSERFAAARFILDPDDPRLAVAACPGAPACKSATTATQDDALRLAPLARRLASQGIALHVSGCAKGCAFPAPAAVTLVANAGLYGVVSGGKAQDPVSGLSLSIEEAEGYLQSLTAARAP